MGHRTDDLKGRGKEAIGDLSGDEDLKQQGKADQAGAKIKEKLERAKGSAEDMVDKAKDEFSGHDR